MDGATAEEDGLKAALADALRALGNKDHAPAYWARRRAGHLVTAINAVDATAARDKLYGAYEAYAQAAGERLQAEDKIADAKATRAKAADQLGAAAAAVQRALAAAVKTAKGGP